MACHWLTGKQSSESGILHMSVMNGSSSVRTPLQYAMELGRECRFSRVVQVFVCVVINEFGCD